MAALPRSMFVRIFVFVPQKLEITAHSGAATSVVCVEDAPCA